MSKGWWQQQGLAAGSSKGWHPLKGWQQRMQRVTAARAGGKGWNMYEQGLVVSVQGWQHQWMASIQVSGSSKTSGSSNGWHQFKEWQQQQMVASSARGGSR
jgi:hypothetical protein